MHLTLVTNWLSSYKSCHKSCVTIGKWPILMLRYAICTRLLLYEISAFKDQWWSSSLQRCSERCGEVWFDASPGIGDVIFWRDELVFELDDCRMAMGNDMISRFVRWVAGSCWCLYRLLLPSLPTKKPWDISTPPNLSTTYITLAGWSHLLEMLHWTHGFWYNWWSDWFGWKALQLPYLSTSVPPLGLLQVLGLEVPT